MGITTKKSAVVEPLFSSADVPAAKDARHRLDTLLKTNQTVTMNIGPVMAEEMLLRNTGNRTMRSRHVKRLADAMRAGEWRLTGQPIIFAKDGTLNDGQHRLSAIVESGMVVRTDVRFGVDRDAFVVTDIGNKRIAADALAIAGEKNSALLAAAIRLAIAFDAGDFHFKTAAAPNEVMEILEKNPDFRGAAATVEHKWRKEFPQIRPSVLVFTYRTCAAIDAADADTFFDRLTLGIDIRRANDPIRVARSYFINTDKERGIRPTKDQVAVIFKAWNAWRKGETRKFLRLRTEGSPEAFPIPR